MPAGLGSAEFGKAELGKATALMLFGSPGSGKGTQSKYIAVWLGVPQISTGDILREHIRLGDAIGRANEGLLRAGSLVSDELANDLVRERISREDCRDGFILDGYPRTLAQAEEITRVLAESGIDEVVIHLVVDYNVIISRIAGRRVCPVCGTLYNSSSHPPKADGICDVEGAKLVIRADDREDVVRERLRQYEEWTRPLIEFFRKSGHRLYEVDSSDAPPEAVFQRVREKLQGLMKAERFVAGK